MKAEKLYPIISDWIVRLNGQIGFDILKEMNDVKELCEKEIRDNSAKTGGIKNICKCANAIIKNAKKCQPNKTQIHGMYVDKNASGDDVYCVCDGYVAVRFNKSLPLEEADADDSTKFHLNNIVRKQTGAQQIVLPEYADIITFSKTCGKDDLYCINDATKTWVNPHYLVNIMGCLPNATAYARDGVSAIYFEAENGDGVLMPARPKKYRGDK